MIPGRTYTRLCLLFTLALASLMVIFKISSGAAGPAARHASASHLESVPDISALVDDAILSFELVSGVKAQRDISESARKVEQECIDAITSNARPGPLLHPACQIHNESNVEVARSGEELLCCLLLRKTILLAGGRQLHHLHLSLLRQLTTTPFLPGKNAECPGRESCTWHEICSRDTAVVRDAPQLTAERRTRVPPNSTILRYAYAPSLFADRDEHHARYEAPYVAPETGVRESTKFWRKHALHSEIVVLHRSPVPAPAWSYEGQGFELRLNNSRYSSSLPSLSPLGQAAWNATLSYWLPSVVNALTSVRPMREASPHRPLVIIWVAESFKPNEAKDSRASFLKYQTIMQARFLRHLLPHYDIPLIACSPAHTTAMDALGGSTACEGRMIDALSYILLKTLPGESESPVD